MHAYLCTYVKARDEHWCFFFSWFPLSFLTNGLSVNPESINWIDWGKQRFFYIPFLPLITQHWCYRHLLWHWILYVSSGTERRSSCLGGACITSSALYSDVKCLLKYILDTHENRLLGSNHTRFEHRKLLLPW